MTSRSGRVDSIARLIDRCGLTTAWRHIHRQFGTPGVRVVNYHDVPLAERDTFRHQLDLMLSRFRPLDYEGLSAVLEGAEELDRDAIVVTFDDGFMSHARWVAEELEQREMCGWFFVPTAAPSVPPESHVAWARDHQLLDSAEQAMVDGRVFADWDMWRAISTRHVVGSHTHNHVRFGPTVAPDTLSSELDESRQALAREVPAAKPVFCWVGGELTSYSARAASAIRDAGFEMSFATSSRLMRTGDSPLRIERSNLESSFPIERVELVLSGVTDLRYAAKRRKLNRVFTD